MAARGKIDSAPVIFQPCQSLDNAGVLFVLPALIANGLLSYQDHYQPLSKVYYSLDFTVLLLSFIFLARIKNPEQLKHISSNEFGKLLGIDRIPEVKRLRMRLSDISAQEKAEEWMQHLFEFWVENDQNESFFFYIDGHVSVYHGKNAHPGKKHVSRQRCSSLYGYLAFYNFSDFLPRPQGAKSEKLLGGGTGALLVSPSLRLLRYSVSSVIPSFCFSVGSRTSFFCSKRGTRYNLAPAGGQAGDCESPDKKEKVILFRATYRGY